MSPAGWRLVDTNHQTQQTDSEETITLGFVILVGVMGVTNSDKIIKSLLRGIIFFLKSLILIFFARPLLRVKDGGK